MATPGQGRFPFREPAILAARMAFAARAQQPRVPVIGLLTLTAPDKTPNLQAAFRKGLSEIPRGHRSAVAPWSGG
jgi:hypothetical protein